MWFVYILKCADKTFYTGITTDLKRRENEHNDSVKGAKYTRIRRPSEMIYFQSFSSRSQAAKEENRIKRLSRKEKLSLIAQYNINKEKIIYKYMHSKIKQIGIEAVKTAGDYAAKKYLIFKRSDAMFKKGKEIVTKVDLGSEKIIISAIKKHFPDASILSEESGEIKNNSDYLWVIDPIDGTTNFTIHNPLWAVSVGVFYKNEPIAGFVYAPILKEMFVAYYGKGAFLNGHRIKISSKKKEKEIHTFGHGGRDIDLSMAIDYFAKQKKVHLDCRQLGSASIDLAYVAAGRVESIVIPGARSWDVAAGVLLVREAGGVASDFAGNDWNLESENVIGANKIVYKEILHNVKAIAK